MYIETLIKQLDEIRAQRDHLKELIDFLSWDYFYRTGYKISDRSPIHGVPRVNYQETFLEAVERSLRQKARG